MLVSYTMLDLGNDLVAMDGGDVDATMRVMEVRLGMGRNVDLTERLARRLKQIRDASRKQP